MGQYLNPADRVREVGMMFDPEHDSVPAGHVGVGVYDADVFRVAFLLSPENREHQDAKYKHGYYVAREYFVVPIEIARKMGATVRTGDGT